MTSVRSGIYSQETKPKSLDKAKADKREPLGSAAGALASAMLDGTTARLARCSSHR